MKINQSLEERQDTVWHQNTQAETGKQLSIVYTSHTKNIKELVNAKLKRSATKQYGMI